MLLISCGWSHPIWKRSTRIEEPSKCNSRACCIHCNTAPFRFRQCCSNLRMQQLDEESARYLTARQESNFDVAAVIAGESSGLVHDIAPVREIVDRMVREASGLLAHGRPQIQVADA